ncbi:DUF1684 domain-containing protein [Costertonia aggregata]|uniref:DUF1684 domain-containing protein n=1 Tax=Costertonia aggregata TaxID=343403 RepID=A0A7H9AS19_9FLAO|nr:DUF1684 domain-containing protein [Costertonia aggregata]QLG46244.1 DUF1684 domain-containing protein [Costertonia aggregata]
MKYIFVFFGLMIFGCKTEKKYHDEKKEEIALQSTNALSEIKQFQDNLNEEFKNPNTSPLPDRYRKNFESLDFFPPDTTFRVLAKFERTPNALPFMMPTTTERQSEEVVYGIATFELMGDKYKLEIYQSPELIKEEEYENYLFLPFLDDTNGKETYAGGRYIDLTIPNNDTIVIDFNKAYNPYCAYNKKYSCPIVPTVNTLNTKILAGVKTFKK